MKKLYLIDGMSLVFRAYHAMLNSNLTSPSGEPTYAVFGFINIISSLIDNHNPENIVVAFDTSAPTFRHEKFEAYKANRDEFPEPLVPQLLRIKEFLTLAGITQIEKPGYEADDVIGTLAKKMTDYEVYCITSDKDYYQLVDERIKLLKPSRTPGKDFDLVDIEEVFKKFGVKPEQVIDVLALIGDASDNVPGVKGIGDKTAIPLIAEFGTVEALYENIDKVAKEGVKTKLLQGIESAFIAKDLVTIHTKMEIEDLQVNRKPIDNNKLAEFFGVMNFTNFRKKWLKDSNGQIEFTENKIHRFDKSKVKYELIYTADRLKQLCDKLSKYDYISVDTETSSLDVYSCNIAGVSLSAVENEAYYIAIDSQSQQSEMFSQDSLFDIRPANINTNIKKLDSDTAFSLLKPLLENPNIKKCGHNLKFDAHVLKAYNVNLSPIAFDSMLAGYLLNPTSRHSMDAMSVEYLNYEPISISTLIGTKKSEQKSMTDLDPELISDYAAEDADVALKLKNVLLKDLEKESLIKLAEEIEFPLIEVLTDMEHTGVKIDKSNLGDISVQIAVTLNELTEKIFNESGEKFNIDSPKQLAVILFEKMMLPTIKKTKTGYSTDVDTLNELKGAYPIAEYLVEYRQLTKLQSTYLEALPKLINPKTGRVHTTYNQTIAGTGRLSSTDPNLQNIPIRSELGKEIRKAFVPGKPNYIMISADYSQVELRVMAYYSKDVNLINAFKNNLDIHSATASILFDVGIEQVDSDKRRVAKTVNFGIMYGLGAFGLAQRLSISRHEASEIIKNYFDKYPGIKTYMDETIAKAELAGYAETLCGRRRYYPDLLSSNNNLKTAAQRAAINMPIQGTASDMMKIAMINIYHAINNNKLKSKMLLQVHDELVFESPVDEADTLISLVKYEMENALILGDVPIIAEVGTGANWFAAH